MTSGGRFDLNSLYKLGCQYKRRQEIAMESHESTKNIGTITRKKHKNILN